MATGAAGAGAGAGALVTGAFVAGAEIMVSAAARTSGAGGKVGAGALLWAKAQPSVPRMKTKTAASRAPGEM